MNYVAYVILFKKSDNVFVHLQPNLYSNGHLLL